MFDIILIKVTFYFVEISKGSEGFTVKSFNIIFRLRFQPLGLTGRRGEPKSQRAEWMIFFLRRVLFE